MKREDAIARHGRHYVLNTHSRTIYESLGPGTDGDDDAHIADDTAAAEEMRDRLTDAAMTRIARIDEIFARTGNRIQLFMAQRGWHRQAEHILAGAQKLRDERAALQKQLMDDFEGAVKHERLPEELRIPVALDVGQPVYIVRACYLEEGIKLTTARITDRRIWSGSAARGDWHYVFSYGAADERGQRLSFEYNRASTDNPEIDNNIHGVRYFLTREAAEDHMLDVAARMSAHFSSVAVDLRCRLSDRKRADGAPAPRP
jgi:hypothetical protein